VEFFVSVGIICGIAVALAILMVIAESTIGNYGIVKVLINDGDKDLDVEGGQNLLTTLKSEKVFIPSACGGRGSCGLCKCKVKSGAGDILPTELPWLDAQERQDNIRLACQIKVKRDISLEIPEELLYVREFQTQVTDITDLTHDIKQVTLKLLDPVDIEFKSGQFAQIETPEYELTDEPVYRAYSISSIPSQHDAIEMEIRLVPNGICTTYVHNHLKVGQKVTMNGPYGDFRRSDTQKPMVCIAGGSGMAPLKSILLDMLEKGINRKCYYFFGARSKRDLFLTDLMQELEGKLPDFKFIAALSEPDEADNWEGETGLITDVVARHIEDATEMEGYLCGSPFMIDACIKTLTGLGMPEESIFYDKFA
jgi:Na+-transporting NADH:ubiquinone oxidoreductase subunit F